MASREILYHPKAFGQLVRDDFCARCFWITMQCFWMKWGHRHTRPYQLPEPEVRGRWNPNWFSVRHFVERGSTPAWLAPLGDLGQPLRAPSEWRFQTFDARTSVVLKGAPKEMFRRPDGSLAIVKTLWWSSDEKYLPDRVLELNAYAYIAESESIGRVSCLGLVYYGSPDRLIPETGIMELGGAKFKYVARVVPIEVRPSMIPPLLEKIRELSDLPAEPTGRTGCKQCDHMTRAWNQLRDNPDHG